MDARSFQSKKRTFLSILLPSGIFPILFYLAATNGSQHEKLLSCGIMLSLSTSVGLAAFRLFLSDENRRTGLIFLNWAIFFSTIPISFLIFLFFESALLAWDPFADVYRHQYEAAVYFLLLPTSTIYAALAVILRDSSTLKVYLLSVAVVGAMWLPQFMPYFENARYLYTTPDIIDYKSLAAGIDKLKKAGTQKPSPREIVDNSSLYSSSALEDRPETYKDDMESRVYRLLPFLEGDNYIPLVYRPLNLSGVYMSSLSVVAIMLYLVYGYRYDPPIPAYHDKVMLLMLLYSICEAFHSYFNLDIATKDTLFAINELGQLVSAAIMFFVVWIFYLRLQFLASVEGRYYESAIRRDQLGITRWRDMIDDWVIRKFIRGEGLSRRFLIREGFYDLRKSERDENKSS